MDPWLVYQWATEKNLLIREGYIGTPWAPLIRENQPDPSTSVLDIQFAAPGDVGPRGGGLLAKWEKLKVSPPPEPK